MMEQREAQSDDRLLNIRETLARIGNPSRTTLWRWCRSKQFPSPLQIGPRRIAWSEKAVLAWVRSRPLVITAQHIGTAE
jgi:predicted DNA-binding transcriptional regulator AlpA